MDSEVGNTAGGAALGVWTLVEIKSLVLDVLTLRCSFNLQEEMSDRHFDIHI